MRFTSTIYDCPIIPLNKITNDAGNITVVENMNHIPFNTKRIYYLYDIPAGAERGGHAHKQLHQLIVATSGSFDVLIDDGKIKKIVQLNHPNIGLLVVPGIWRELLNFSSGAICLVLASHEYCEEDYIRDYKTFTSSKNGSNSSNS